jgi:hypothetical protein
MKLSFFLSVILTTAALLPGAAAGVNYELNFNSSKEVVTVVIIEEGKAATGA